MSPRRSWKLAFVSGFCGDPTGALPLDLAGGLPSLRHPRLSPYQIPGDPGLDQRSCSTTGPAITWMDG